MELERTLISHSMAANVNKYTYILHRGDSPKVPLAIDRHPKEQQTLRERELSMQLSCVRDSAALILKIFEVQLGTS
jgi:hypothetical protein